MLLKGLAFVDQIEGPSEIKPSLNKAGHLPPAQKYPAFHFIVWAFQHLSSPVPLWLPEWIYPLCYYLLLRVQLPFHCPVIGLLSSQSLAEASEGEAPAGSLVLHNKHPDACWTMSLLAKLHRHCPLCVCPSSIKSEYRLYGQWDKCQTCCHGDTVILDYLNCTLKKNVKNNW